jgi:4-amino-4-deoxy-L-arabinose transferase-like glycosyltransferase
MCFPGRGHYDIIISMNNNKIVIYSKIEKIYLVVLLLAASFLLLTRLGERCMWQDEAQTALIAKTVLTNGIPMGSDALNSFSQEAGAETNKNGIFIWHPWMQFYMVAASFTLFGANTFAARLPFVLAGLITILIVFFITREITGKRIIAMIAGLLIVFSVPFIIMTKQVRYYSPVMLFSLLCLYEYLLVVSGKRKTFVPLGAYAVALFYSQTVYFGCVFVTLALHSAIFKREYFIRIIRASVVSFLFCLPWLLYSSVISYNKMYPDMMTLKKVLDTLPLYVLVLNEQILPLVLLLVPILIRTVFKKKISIPSYNGKAALIAIFVATNIIMLSFFSVSYFYRYLMALLPLAPVALAVIFGEIAKIKYLKWVVPVCVLFFLSPVLNYFYELTHKYRGPVEGIVAYLEANADKNDLIFITYEDMPVKFYTGLKVIGGLTGGSFDQAKNARWVIPRKYIVTERMRPALDWIKYNLNVKNYKKIILNYPETDFGNREYPGSHYFATQINNPPVIIYEKIK